MTNKPTGGPAYPFPAYTYPNGEINHGEGGMTLRDAIAIAAMQGLLSNREMGDAALHNSGAEWVKDITESAFEFADAMLLEREK